LLTPPTRRLRRSPEAPVLLSQILVPVELSVCAAEGAMRTGGARFPAGGANVGSVHAANPRWMRRPTRNATSTATERKRIRDGVFQKRLTCLVTIEEKRSSLRTKRGK
jgi:hypothetical protein